MQQKNLKQQFLLKGDVTYLNFGAYGACPKPVFERYQSFQREMEEEPSLFMNVKGPEYLRASRAALAGFLNCDADDVVYVTNPTYAVNIVAKSLDLKPGDEVMTTNLEYGASDRTWRYYAGKKGYTYQQQNVRFPIESKQDFLKQFLSKVTEKTRLIFISHITSSTALQLPVLEICAFAKENGILTFIDGAHAPGQADVDLKALGANMYTGACHKWMLTPKGSSFLYVEKRFQHLFDPLLISWGYASEYPSGSQFQDYHQMQGTRDYSAFLTIPAALQFMKENDWQTVASQCKTLAMANADRFCTLLRATPLCPVTNDFISQMYSIPLQINSTEKLHDVLYEKYRIQVPVMKHGGRFYLRYSIQAFNSEEDLDKLYDALREVGA
jgi:isopenicillin-N epimerase